MQFKSNLHLLRLLEPFDVFQKYWNLTGDRLQRVFFAHHVETGEEVSAFLTHLCKCFQLFERCPLVHELDETDGLVERKALQICHGFLSDFYHQIGLFLERQLTGKA